MTPAAPLTAPLAVPAAPPAGPALLTADEFARRHAGQRLELVKGVLLEVPMPSAKHGKLCGLIAYFLTHHALTNDCGHVMTNDSFVRTRSNPDTVRGADVCYFSYQRLPRGPVPEGLLPVAPDLVVEVRSPSDSWTGIYIKLGEYLEAGVRVVVVLDEHSLTATVYRPDVLPQILAAADDLTLPDVLPDFRLPVGRLFQG